MVFLSRFFLLGMALFTLTTTSSVAEDKETSPKLNRFDLEVREDIFAGLNGDKERMTRGIQKCNEALKNNPKNAEARVWRGAARIFQAGEAFRDKKQAEGIQLWTNGLKDMDDAVEQDPRNVGVRVPRAVVLLPAARFVAPAMAKPLLEKVRADFEQIHDLQKAFLDKLGTHPRGELRMGMAEVYRRLNEPEKSRMQLETIVKEMPDSKYAEEAREWLKARPEANLSHTCIGCHRR